MEQAWSIIIAIGFLVVLLMCVIWLVQNPLILLGLGLCIAALMLAGFVAYALSSVNSKAKNGFIEDDDPSTMRIRRSITNGIRKVSGKLPVLVLPKSKIQSSERDLTRHLNVVITEIREALSRSPVSAEKKMILRREVSQVPANITDAMWRLYRLRRLQDLPYDQTSLNEMQAMDSSTVALIRDSVTELMAMPVSLMQVETAREDSSADRRILEVREINQRLREQREAYDEVRRASLPGGRNN
jgi:hypothetical protein